MHVDDRFFALQRQEAGCLEVAEEFVGASIPDAAGEVVHARGVEAAL